MAPTLSFRQKSRNKSHYDLKTHKSTPPSFSLSMHIKWAHNKNEGKKALLHIAIIAKCSPFFPIFQLYRRSGFRGRGLTDTHPLRDSTPCSSFWYYFKTSNFGWQTLKLFQGWGRAEKLLFCGQKIPKKPKIVFWPIFFNSPAAQKIQTK